MLRYAILLAFVFFVAEQAAAANCTGGVPKIEQSCTFTRYKDDDDQVGETITVDANRTLCNQYDEHCCWRNDRCYTITTKGPKVTTGNIVKPKKIAARFLPGFKPPIPPFCPEDKETVPANCEYKEPQPYVTDPPVDVPYCVRIPCTLDRRDQAQYDRDQFKCGSQPGCYFDVELADFREAFGPGVLSGVPVCQLAIRHPFFLNEAQKTIALAGSWNPYYTACLLDRFKEEIEKERDGCKFIDVLRVFKVNPKMAGWKGINRRMCTLIGGCWKYAQCFYPYEIDQDLTVKSGQKFNINDYEIRFGRPKCQEFDNRTPYTTLKSYHNCLLSGCSVDKSVSNNYYMYFFKLGEGMTDSDVWKYWPLVESGKITSHNFEESMVWDYKKSGEMDGSDSSNLPPPSSPPPPRQSGPFSPPVGGGSLPPQSLPRGATFSRPQGGFTPPLRAGATQACGFEYLGFRPCPPRLPPVLPKHAHCPYKPFYVPRFEPLRGSFEGCCDVNLCYLSRSDIRKMHSGPSQYLSEWTYWSKCTKSCGAGIRTRTRTCIGHNKEKCADEPLKEIEPCEDAICGKWSKWSEWFPPCDCRRAFPFGGTERKRRCNPPGAICEGEEEEAMGCPEYCQTYEPRVG